MDTEEGQSNRGVVIYRRVLLAAIVVVAGFSIWMSLPPPKVDLGFLATLHPTRVEDSPQFKQVWFSQKPAEVERLLDQQLTEKRGWKKTSALTPGYITYHFGPRGMPSVTLQPISSSGIAYATRPPPGTKAPPAHIDGSQIQVDDARDVVQLPKR